MDFATLSGPLAVASACRSGDLKVTRHDPANVEDLCGFIMQTKQLRNFPGLLGFAEHPWVRRMLANANRRAWLAVLSRIVYRVDEVDAFESFTKANRWGDQINKGLCLKLRKLLSAKIM